MVKLTKTRLRKFLNWAYQGSKAAEIQTEYPALGKYKGYKISVRDFYQKGLVARGIVKDDWSTYKGSDKRLMMCPLHGDEKPSMGTIFDRDGVELFNCFGCRRAGTVIDLAEGCIRKYGKSYYSSALEWVVRACSGDLGYSELVRFANAVSKSDVGEEIQSRGYSESDNLILEAADLNTESSLRDVLDEYSKLEADYNKTKVFDVAGIQRVFIASLLVKTKEDNN